MSPYYPPSGSGSASSSGLAGVVNHYLTTSDDTTILTNSLVIQPGSSATAHVTGSNYYINAITGGGAATTLQPTVPGNIPMSSVRFVNISTTGLISNNYDLYTVPVGKRALVMGCSVGNNSVSSTANMSSYVQVKTNNLYYRINPPNTSASGSTIAFDSINFISDAGEIIGVNISLITSQATVNMRIIEFDTSINLRTAKNYLLTSGNNTIFISTFSSTAVSFNSSTQFGGAAPIFEYMNGTSGSDVTRWFLVDSNAAVTEKYMIIASNSVASLAKSNRNAQISITSGQSLVMYSSTSAHSQVAWFTYQEL